MKNTAYKYSRLRFFRWSVILLPVLVILFIFRELAQGLFFNNDDVLMQLLPYLQYAGSNGSIIAQNLMFGFPLYVTVGGMQLFPVYHFILSLLPSTTAYAALDVAYLILAYISTYAYARAIGIARIPAVLVGMVYVFSGQTMLWSSSLINTSYYFLLPLSLLLIEYAFAAKNTVRRYGYLSLVGVFLGIGWLSSHVQFVVYIHTFLAVYVLFKLWSRIRVSVYRGLLETGGILAYIYALSALVGAPVIFAVLSFQPDSVRATGVSLKSFFTGSYMPWDAIHFVLPFWHVDFIPFSSPNLYLGVMPLLLVLSFLVISLHKGKATRTVAQFYFWVLGFCLFASIDYSPLGAVLHFLPIFDAFREAPRIMFIGGFAEAVLAGIAYETLLAAQTEMVDMFHIILRLAKIAVLYVLTPFFILMSVVKIFLFGRILALVDEYFFAHLYAHTTKLPPEHYALLIKIYLYQSIDGLSLFSPQVDILLLCVISTLVWYHYRERVSTYTFGVIGLVLVAFNFGLVYQNRGSYTTLAELNRTPNTVSFLKSAQGKTSLFRIFPLFPGMSIYNAQVACSLNPDQVLTLQQEMLKANGNMYYGIDSIDGYDNFMPSLVSNALGYVGADGSLNPARLVLQHIPLSEKIKTVEERKNVLRAMNVRYITSLYQLTDPSFTEVYHEQVGPCHTQVYVYELKGTWPRYFTTENVATVSNNPTNSSAMLERLNTETRPIALLSASKGERIASSSPNATAPVTEVMPSFSRNALIFSNVSCNKQCVLVIGNAFLSGYRAYVDGVPMPIKHVNYLFMAVPLAPGRHTIRLEYPGPLPW